MKLDPRPTEAVTAPPPVVALGEAAVLVAVEERVELAVVEEATSSEESDELPAPHRCWSAVVLGDI